MMEKFLKRISAISGFVSVAALSVCVLTNSYEIIGRSILSRSNYWIQDFTSFCMVWFVFSGIVTITWEKKDIFIDLLLDALPDKAARIVRMVVLLMLAGFTSFLSVKIFQYMQLNAGKYMTTAPIPQNLNTVAMLLSMIILAIINLYDFVLLLKKAERSTENTDEGVEL
ncbi:MAG: TRAP transporter small permease subunit [Clostridiaceae bacterium]|jgi:TRAP-type C4-dicarboxylate transport system permease small subunit|nr:TRAP transporter small permease subunit [Clostridiaceae bacterium]